MSIHKSLKVSSKLVRSRNVFTRGERIDRLKELGKWDEKKDSLFHLPKVKTQWGKKVGKKKKEKKKEEEGAAEGAAAPAAGAAAPAAGAKAAPAAGAKAAAPAAGAKAAEKKK
jgi:small basic protein (TIGR04137 family)